MSIKQRRSNSRSKSFDEEYFEVKGRAQSARVTSVVDEASLARLFNESYHHIPGEPDFQPFKGKVIPLGPYEHIEEAESRVASEEKASTKIIIRNTRRSSKGKKQATEWVEEDEEEACSQRKGSSSKKEAGGKKTQFENLRRETLTNYSPIDRLRSEESENQENREEEKEEEEVESQEEKDFEVLKVIRKKRFTINPLTNEKEEFKPQGKEVVFPEMEIMLCQIILGFNAHSFHATQSDLCQLALRMLQFMNQHGFYKDYEPDLKTLTSTPKQPKTAENTIPADDISVSSLGEIEEEDSLLDKPKSKKTLFRASKGWVEKFLFRNERVAMIYRYIREKDFRRHYKRIGKERLSWLIWNPTWDALLQKNIKNGWEKNNKIEYDPPHVAESNKKNIKKAAIGKEKKPRKKREPKKNVTEIRVDPREEEERLKLKYEMSEESYSFSGSIVHEKIKLPSGKRMVLHYNRHKPDRIIQEKLVSEDGSEAGSCKKRIGRSRKGKVIGKSKKIKKEKKVAKRCQAQEQEQYERMVDESVEESQSEKENKKQILEKKPKGKGKAKDTGSKKKGKAAAGKSPARSQPKSVKKRS